MKGASYRAIRAGGDSLSVTIRPSSHRTAPCGIRQKRTADENGAVGRLFTLYHDTRGPLNLLCTAPTDDAVRCAAERCQRSRGVHDVHPVASALQAGLVLFAVRFAHGLFIDVLSLTFSVHAMLSFRPLTSTVAACVLVIGGLFAGAPSVHAQSFDIESADVCDILQQIPQTEGVVSILTEEWIEGIWRAADRQIYSYSDGNLADIVFQVRLFFEWQNDTRARSEYDNSGRLKVCTLQDWDPTQGGRWANATRIERTFDGDGNVETILISSWEDDDWEPLGRSTLSYDDDGNVTERVTEAWDRDAEQWIPGQRTENTYDGSGNLTEKLEQVWLGDWIDDRLTMNTYDAEGALEQTIVQSRPSPFSLDLENDTRTTYTRENKSIVETAIEDTWDGADWTPAARTTTQINDDGLPTERIEDTREGGDWVRSNRTETSYVTVGGIPKVLSTLEQTCGSNCVAPGATWENVSQTMFSYTEVLPVELASFVVAESDDGALLTWETASETNNAGFEIQRRVGPDGAFASLGFVDGAGTTSAPQQYRFSDADLPFTAEQVTYRLKQIDVDGAFEYSPEVELNRNAPARLALHGNYPNPFRDQTTIRYELPQPESVRLEVFDVRGRRVAQLVTDEQPAGRNEIAFQADRLPSGIYFVRLLVDGQSLSRRMTVVR